VRDTRHKKSVVDPAVQAVFVRRFLLCWICCTLLAAVLLTAIYTLARPDQQALQHFGAVIASHWPILAASLAMLPVILWDAVRFSRRVAGPICGVRRSLSRHASGEQIRPLHFRGNDLWKDLGDQINVLLNRVQEFEAKAAAERSPQRADRVVLHDQQTRDTSKRHAPSPRRKATPRGLFRVLAPPHEAASTERSRA